MEKEQEMIKQVNELYRELGSYAAVSRELGITTYMVKKYYQPDYVNTEELEPLMTTEEVNEVFNQIENHIPTDVFLDEEMSLIPSEEEKEELDEIRGRLHA